MFFSSAYRKCADELGKLDGIDLTVLTVDSWIMNSRLYDADPLHADSPYRFILGKSVWRGKENRGFYRNRFLQVIHSVKPDVIFLMEEPFSLFALEILTARALLCPSVPVVNFTWNNLSLDQFDYRPSWWYRNVARWTLPRIQSILTANTDGIEVLRNARYTGPVRSIGYGVDTSLFTSSLKKNDELRYRYGIQSDDVVIGFVGRLIRMKGIDLLIEAVSKLQEVNSSKRIILTLVGSGDDEQELLSQAEKCLHRHTLKHIPVVKQTEVPSIMQSLDILVLPSRRVGMWAEQFGRVLVEAMASRTLVVGSSSGAIPEVIGDAGWIFAENDADDLFRQLQSMLDLNSESRNLYLERGVQRATERFSWKRFAEQSAEALRQAVES